MDDDIQTLTGDSAPPEPSPGETESLETSIDAGIDPPDPDSDADVTGDTGEEQEADDPPERKPVPYDRFKKVNEERKAFAKALEDAGMRFDEETRQVVPIAQEDDGLDWETPAETAAPDEQADPDTFWSMSAEDMASDPTWRTIAAQLGFDPDEAVRNEWATVKALARTQAEQQASRQAAMEAAEVQARTELSKELKALKADPEFSVSPKAVAFVDAEAKRFKEAGYSASQIKAILPGIQAKAFYENRKDYIAAEAQRLVKGESARTVRMGAQSPESTPDKSSVSSTSLTQDERELCDMAGISYQKYAERKEKANGSV